MTLVCTWARPVRASAEGSKLELCNNTLTTMITTRDGNVYVHTPIFDPFHTKF